MVYSKEKTIVSALLALFALLHIPFLFRGNLWWDEVVYIGMGKFLWSFGSVGLWESIRPPLLPFLLGGIWSAGGGVIASHVLILCFALGSLYLLYKIGKSYDVPIVALLILASTPVFFLSSTRLLTGMVGTFFLLAAFYAYQQDRFLLMSLFAGLATLSRFPLGLFFVVFLAFSAWKYAWWKQVGVFCLALLPYFLLNLPNPFHSLFLAMTHQSNVVFAQPWWFYSVVFLHAPLLLFAVVGGVIAWKKKRYELIALSVVPLLYFFLITNQQERFLLPVLPFLALLASFFLKKYPALVFLGVGIALSFVVLPDLTTLPEHATLFLPGEVVLSATPYPALSDTKVIPYYADVETGYAIFTAHLSEVDYVVHTNASFPCAFYPDPEACFTTRGKFASLLGERVLEETIDGELISVQKPFKTP